MRRRNYHKHEPAPFSLYNQSTTASRYISHHKNRGQKKPGKRRSDRSCAWTSRCLRKVGGGGGMGKRIGQYYGEAKYCSETSIAATYQIFRWLHGDFGKQLGLYTTMWYILLLRHNGRTVLTGIPRGVWNPFF